MENRLAAFGELVPREHQGEATALARAAYDHVCSLSPCPRLLAGHAAENQVQAAANAARRSDFTSRCRFMGPPIGNSSLHTCAAPLILAQGAVEALSRLGNR